MNIVTDLDKIDTHAAPPEKEPERQYYYLARARELAARESARLERPLTACVTTFGCQMNPATMMA